MITVILNCYKRPEYLAQQIEAVQNQTVTPHDIWIWYNKPEEDIQCDFSNLNCKVVTANHNFKFHGRFAFALLAKSEYVALFDDDTIPGEDWFKNCLDTISRGFDGILGTTGVVLKADAYDPNYKVGWNGIQSTDVTQVDLVGHAWFMKRDYLRYLWYEYPLSWENGEDMQLSYLAQKYGNVPTYVPPHPTKELSMWGSIPTKGTHFGNDSNASWRKSNHSKLRNDIARQQIKSGWKLVKDI